MLRPLTESLEPRLLATAFSRPLVITHGGTYTGAWQSLSATVPAVLINTTEPVVIRNSVIRGRGDLIDTGVDDVNITVLSSTGISLNPNVAGEVPGRFLDAEVAAAVDLEGNSLRGTSGILVNHFDSAAGVGSIVIRNNQASNIDGRKSDGHGGFLDFNTRVSRSDGHVEDGFELVQFLQIANSMNVPGVIISWNKVVNTPGQSRVEDNISIFHSGGTADSPILIHDNYIQGAYTIKPSQGNTRDSKWIYHWGYSGGGIMLGDGDAAYVSAYRNVVVSTTNYGIAITAGHDIDFHDNLIVSSAILPDGSTDADQNVGAAIWNAGGQSSSAFYNNTGEENTIGWVAATGRNDFWMPDAASWNDADSLANPITRATEIAALARWKRSLRTVG